MRKQDQDHDMPAKAGLLTLGESGSRGRILVCVFDRFIVLGGWCGKKLTS